MNQTVCIEIHGDNIVVDEDKVTLPRLVQVFNELSANLKKLAPPAELKYDSKGNMAIVSMDTLIKKSDKPAVLKMFFTDGFITGADIQHNGQNRRQVLKAIDYCAHIYCKKLVDISKQLFGDNEEDEKEWLERVANGGPI